MAKLYVFAIGGTGSRVLRSLTMLLASGCKLPNGFDTLVPIIIDPDSANGDLERTTDILVKYQRIKNQVGETENFFHTSIRTLRNLSEENLNSLADNFIFKISGTANQSFEDFINYQGLESDSKGLMELLYTKEELNSSMEVGFKGKPNIGSIVLNQLIDNAGYTQFASKFDQGDAIFIVSSIFGGTGAAGFPLLLKNLRTELPQVPNSNLISDAIIGAISYLPYFKITPPKEGERSIDSNTFFSKAQAALNYYEHAIFESNQLNAFYYLGDNSQNDYPHNDGKADQKNNAHFLEMAGALAIIDFVEEIPNHSTVQKEAIGKTSKEFGVSSDGRRLQLQDLGQECTKIVRQNLAKFALTEKFLRKSLQYNLESNTSWVKVAGFNRKDFFDQDFFQKDMAPLMDYFKKWLDEMASNDVAFKPFHDQNSHDNLLNFINGIKVENSILKKRAKADRLTDELNKSLEVTNKGSSNEKEFIDLFDQATGRIIDKILN